MSLSLALSEMSQEMSETASSQHTRIDKSKQNAKNRSVFNYYRIKARERKKQLKLEDKNALINCVSADAMSRNLEL